MKRLYVNPALNTDRDCLLTYMCVDCKKTYKEIFDRYFLIHLKTDISFVMETLKTSVCVCSYQLRDSWVWRWITSRCTRS